MPIYEYKCKCGNQFEVSKSMENSNTKEYCNCGLIAEKKFSIPFVIGDTCSIYNHALDKQYESKKQMEKDADKKGFVGLTTSCGKSMHEQMKEEKAKRKKEKDAIKRKEFRKHFDKAAKECHHLKES